MKQFLLLMLCPVLCLGQTQKIVSSSSSSITPLTAPPGYPIPGRFWADNGYDSGAVSSPQTDTLGGYSNHSELDSITNGGWDLYGCFVSTTSAYTISFRVATAGPGASLQVLNYGTGAVLATVNLPNTGGLAQWQTVTAPISLAQGGVTLKVQSTSNTLWALFWVDVEFPNTPPPADAQVVPGMIQAESFFHSNLDTVPTHNTSDFGKGLDVGRLSDTDYLDYYLNIPDDGNGVFTISMRVATNSDSAVFEFDDVQGFGEITRGTLPNTGGFQKWQTVNVFAQIHPGTRIIRLRCMNKAKWNINWMFIVEGSQSSGWQTIPGLIQGEWFIFESGVGTEPTSDPGGVFDVGWIDKNDWMNYKIVVNSAGTYMANFRVATIDAHASFKVFRNDGTELAAVHLPNTGGYQSWSTVSVPLTLKAGVDTMWIVSTSDYNWNLDWMQFTAVTDTTATTTAALAGSAAIFGDSISAAGTRLWPNPVRDMFTIQLDDGYSGNIAVQITDAAGVVRQVTNFVKAPGVNQVTINASGLSTGVYFVRVLTGAGQEVRKIFKL